MKIIDDFLNNITMYRLVLYFLIILAGIGLVYSAFGVLPYNPINYLLTFGGILIVSYIANSVFAHVFEAPTNSESVWISALILGLIITPPTTLSGVIFIGWAATLMATGKFIFAIGKKHIFNPVALAVFLTTTFINGSASWWIGNVNMLPFVAIGGFLIVRKLKRWDLVLSFLGVSLLTIFIATLLSGGDILGTITKSILDLPLVFFAGIMLTEPLTTPPTKTLRIIYGGLVGFLIAPQIHFGGFYTTPEIALIIGNIFSYLVSPKYKLMLTLKQKIQLTPDTFDFVFDIPALLKFTPGQYMEFTLAHEKADDRGNRRYLSLASSPTEKEIRLGVKFGNPPSSFKRSLYNMTAKDKIVASQLIGDFTLPKDPNKKLVLIAGGIGITPYRSMIKYLIDTNQKRNITVIYTVSDTNQFAYKDILGEAERKLGIKTIYVDTKTQGRMDSTRLAKEIPDYIERIFYISGSRNVVNAFDDVLKKDLNILPSQIVTDYFPGFA